MEKKITYCLTERDYLNYQLFTASQSKLVKKARMRTAVLVPVIFLLMAFFDFAFTDRLLMPILFIVLSIISYFLYPIYQKKLYQKHYKKHIKEHYQNNINKIAELIFFDREFELKDAETDSKIQYSLLEKINEVPDAFYMKLKSSQSVIIPKNNLEKALEVRNFLKKLASEKNIAYEEFPNWKWK